MNYYSLSVNGEKILSESLANSVSWTPDKTGTYEIVAYAKEAEGDYIKTTKIITVEEKSENVVTIYYKGYDNPYIHYKIGNKTWTTLPGIKMTPCTEVEGYKYKIQIDLGDSNNLTACFNNGSGSWDSNGGKNYYFNCAGSYTYCNGSITKIN